MDCPDCDAPVVPFSIPTEEREFVPGGEGTVALCTHCLGFHPAPAAEGTTDPDFTAISTAFPGGKERVAMALIVGLLPSFALYRREIETLVERVERAGTDPLLVLDRLADEEDIEATMDLRRRRGYLEQTLG
jgi:hypothetical protein